MPGIFSGRALRLSLAVAAATMLAVLVPSAPGLAADDPKARLELSRDGIHYAAERLLSVFEAGQGYVPGESRTATIWVRNTSNQARQLSLGVTTTDAASALASHLQLGAAAPGWSGTTAIPSVAGHCTTMMEHQEVAGGQSLPIELNLSFDIKAPNTTRQQVGNFELVFLLQDIAGGHPVSPCAAAKDSRGSGASMGSASVEAGTDPAPVQAPANPAMGQETDAMRPATAMPQSNVVITSHSPWPWLLVLSAGTYAGISLRSRRRTP